MSAKQKIIAARTALVLDQPFFGALALRLAIVEDPTHPTAWTDGQSMGYNPTFIESLTQDEILGVICHEVMHNACGHPWRRDNRERRRFNIAADFAINPIVEAAGFSLPQARLRDAQFDGKSAEWIYDRLPPQQGDSSRGKRSGKGSGRGKGAPRAPADTDGERRPGEGAEDVRDALADGAADGATEADWQRAVHQAAAAAKARGNLPGALERFAKTVVEPRVDWRSVLRRFVQAAARTDYRWTRPNVRHLARGLYLPALHAEALGPIAVAIDTSGSIDAVLLDQFAAELRAIASELRPERVHVIYCDAHVQRIDTFEQDDEIVMAAKGGGGTSFIPALAAADQLDEPPVCVVYLTDQDGLYPPEPPSMPVLWASPAPAPAPFGEVVSMER